ncbi:hypothetical protein OAG1_31020 [Agarivorans sp. OAG1]|uniref:GNAT family N-acetyltransferase n=1 Tax=Agarivorans sp. OAG1 TaxID=3082387 RepID=UPI002B27E7F9|nr:hypothetical protein OAG1_31020 [Agarivorans sp. OAG1]
MHITISEVTVADLNSIVELGIAINEADVIPHLSEQGKQAMRSARRQDMSAVADKTLYQALKAELNGKLVAYVAWREGHYIAQLYVDSAYQRSGVGRQLLTAVKHRVSARTIKLKASCNSLGFYKKLGFVETADPQCRNGISFVPMALELPE